MVYFSVFFVKKLFDVAVDIPIITQINDIVQSKSPYHTSKELFTITQSEWEQHLIKITDFTSTLVCSF